MINNYFSYYSQKYASKWLVLAIDLAIVLFTFFITYFIRFNFTLDFDLEQFLFQLPFLFIVATVSFLIIGSFKSVIRHTGFTDVVNLFKSVTLMSLLSIVFVLFNRITDVITGFTIPLVIIIIHALLSFVVLSASRLLFKMIYSYLKSKLGDTKKVLIYGAADSGIITYNALVSNLSAKYNVVGFIDDDVKKNGKSINGVPIFSKTKVTKTYVEVNGIDEIIVASQTVDSKKLLALIESLIDLNVKITKVPPIEKWINGELSVKQIKQVQIEDL